MLHVCVGGAFHHPNVKCREETDSHSCKSLYIKKKTKKKHQLIPHCFLPVTRRAGVDGVGPGQERTRVTSQALKLCSPFLSKHWPSGSTLPSPSEVLCLLADSFWVFFFILFQFYYFFCSFLFFIFIRLCFHFTLFPWKDFVVLVVPRLNEECVQKPVTERTHSEGTSQHKGRRKTAGVSVFSCSVSSCY